MFQSAPVTYEDVCKHFGTAAAAARKLGLTRAAISLWQKKGIPLHRQLHIQEKTRGKLKAHDEKRRDS